MQNIISRFKKANKTYKLKLANKAGFGTIEDYKQSLLSPPKVSKKLTALAKPKRIAISAPVVAPIKTSLSRTELIKVIESNFNTSMTVCFNKKMHPADVKRQVIAIYPNKGGKLLSKKEFTTNVNSLLNKALKGEERCITGTTTGEKDNFGRFYFDESGEIRLVDTRTITSVEVKRVKYTLKKD